MQLIEKAKVLVKSKTIKNVGYLTVGSAFAQIISLIGAFYIPRILGPEKYGTLNIVTSYVALFTVFSFGGLNKVILRESSRNISKIKQIAEGFIGIKIIFSIAASIVAIMFLLFVNYELTTKYYIILFSISLVLAPLLGTFNTIYQAHEELKYVALLGVIQSILSVSLSILAVTLGYGVLAILLIRLSCSLLMVFSSYKILKKFFFAINFLSKINWDLKFLKQGFNFTLLNVLGVLSTKIDLVMLSFLTTPKDVGIYALAYNIVQRGLIIRRPISASLFPYYTKRYAKQNVEMRELIKHTLIIIIPSIVIIIGVLLSSKYIIATIVGNEFVESAKIVNILIFYLVLNYSVIPLGLALQTTNNEKYSIYIGVATALTNIIMNYALFHAFGLIGIAFSTLIVEFLRVFFAYIIVKKLKIKMVNL